MATTEKKNRKQQVVSAKASSRDRPLKETCSEKVSNLMRVFEEQAKAEGVKMSVAEYLRLLQLKRELDESEGPRDVVVKWIDIETPPSSGA